MSLSLALTLPTRWLRDLVPVADRRAGLGGTDMAAITGHSPFASAYDVWLEKTGQAEPKPDNAAMEWGRLLEPVIARKYMEKVNQVIVRPQGAFAKVGRPWQIGSPDALWEDARHGVEIKTASPFMGADWGEEGTDEIPDAYRVQVAWYYDLVDAEKFDVVPLIGGRDFRIYNIPRDRELEGTLLDAGERFWKDHVLTGKPPMLTNTDGSRAWLKKKFPADKSAIRIATPEEEELLLQYSTIHRTVKVADKQKEDLAIRLKSVIGDSEGLTSTALGRVTWKKNTDGEAIDWEAIARALKADPALIKKHTALKVGPRVLRPYFKD